MRVVVIGAGVIGLSCAIRVAHAGHEVEVRANQIGVETTSALAAAIWMPYRAFPFDRVTAWCAASLPEFTRLAETAPDAGIVVRDGASLLRGPEPDPWWASAVTGLRRGELVRAGYVDSFALRTPVIEMPLYLNWLLAKAGRLGVRVIRAEVAAWPLDCDAIVNATGLLGGALSGDTTIFPIRGQVVLVEQFGLTNWWVDDEELTYLVPRSKDVVIGGTDVDGDWDLRPRPEVAVAILDRAAAIVPEVRGARVLAHRVGLRPGRPEVRLEREELSGTPPIVHCYGHGGAGVTLSWGCADEVRDLLQMV